MSLVDAGESLDLAGPGLLVEALHVALLAFLQRSVDVDLEERQVGLHVQFTGHVSVLRKVNYEYASSSSKIVS